MEEAEAEAEAELARIQEAADRRAVVVSSIPVAAECQAAASAALEAVSVEGVVAEASARAGAAPAEEVVVAAEAASGAADGGPMA